MNVSEDITSCLRAQDHGHPPVICAAFMGGQGARARTIAYRSDGTVPTLKSSPSGTNTVPDVVYCFEPGIAKREGSDSRFVQGRCVTLRAEMGDNQPAICFQQNQREEVRNMGEQVGALTAESGMHNTNYVCYEVPDG